MRIIFWLTPALVVGLAFRAAADERPNILFVFADDWGRYASAYATIDGPGTPNDVVKTPNFDRVAREGVLFRRAFVNAPSCTPCRSALVSGQYFWRTGRGAILRPAVWDSSVPAFPLLLRDAGYDVGKHAKVWSPGSPADAPFGGQKYAYEKAGRRFNNFSENVSKMAAAGQSVDAAKTKLLDEASANFTAFLEARSRGTPFLFWFGPTNVHRKWMRGSGKAIWGIDPEQLKGKLPPFLPDVAEVREDFADYLGEIQALDAALGRLLSKLEEAGELERTIVVVSGDHGPPGFPRGKCNLYDFGTSVSLAIRGPGVAGGRVVDDFVNLMDLAPTFLELGGVKPPAETTGRSLVPVLCSTKSGQVDATRDFVVTGRERHVANARDGGTPYPHRAIRTKDFLYVVNFEPGRWPMGDPRRLDGPNPPSALELSEVTYATYSDMDASPTKAWLVGRRDDPAWRKHYDLAFAKRPREELYDLAKDPHQTTNVAAAPAYEAARRDLSARLMAELTRNGDPRVLENGGRFERPPYAGAIPNEER